MDLIPVPAKAFQQKFSVKVNLFHQVLSVHLFYASDVMMLNAQA